MIMTIVQILIAVLNLNMHTGHTSYYSPGVMEATIEARQEWGHIPDDLDMFAGFVARPYCGEIGDTVYIAISGTGMYEPYLVTDCAVRDDSDGALSWMIDNNVLVEFDYNSAVRLGVVDGGVEIDMITGG